VSARGCAAGLARRLLRWSAVLLLAGCAASMHPDFENVYQRYDVPDALVAKVRENLRRFGLASADVTRDRLGRLQLAGRYANEDEVDRAFVIVQNVVGLQATSMVYPTEVAEKAWEQETTRAFERFLRRQQPVAPSPGTAGGARKYALIVGISRFQDPRVPRLPGAEKDASVLEALLRDPGGYRPSELVVLRDAQATRAAIQSQLERLVREPGPQDSVFVFIASHGVQPIPDPRGREVRKYPVLAFDTRTSSPVAMYDTALHDSHLIDLVRRSRAREVVVVVDTCFSGHVFSNLPDMQLGGADSERYIRQVNGGALDRDGVGTRAIAQRWVPAGGDTTRPAADEPRSARVSVLSASGPGEESRESSGVLPAPSGRSFDGGLFTQSFAEGLRIHQGDVGKAFGYAQVFVSLFVRERTRGRDGQTPQMMLRPEGSEINLFRRI
jgi:hypothetical protein